MYYNTRNNTIENLPLSGYLENGTLVQGLDLADNETRKLCGFLSIISDSPTQPDNTIEDETQRVVNIENDQVSVLRTWIPAPVAVPSTVSARQIRLWLIDHDISLTSVENAINSIVNETLREKTLVEWEFAPYIERNHPLIETLAFNLGLTSEQVDQGFIEASIL
jgi:hypothetical protein